MAGRGSGGGFAHVRLYASVIHNDVVKLFLFERNMGKSSIYIT